LHQFNWREWEIYGKYFRKVLVPYAREMLAALHGPMAPIIERQVEAGEISPRDYLFACDELGLPAQFPRDIAMDPGELRERGG
jgi:hypothetical protein